MLSMLSKVGLLLYLLSNAGDYVSAVDTFDVDRYFEETFKCFWHMACTINEILKIKNTAEPILAPQIIYVLTELMPHVDEKLRIFKSVEDFRSDDVWLNDYAIHGCALSKEEREKLISEVFFPFIDHFRKICYDKERRDQCAALGLASGLYQDLQKEMLLRKECNFTTGDQKFL